MEYTAGFILLVALCLGCSLGGLLMLVFKVSDPEERSEQPQLPRYDLSAALLQELPGLSNQRPLAAHGPPHGGGSSRAEDWPHTSARE